MPTPQESSLDYAMSNLCISTENQITVRFCNLPSYLTRFDFRRLSPSSLEQVWTPQCTLDKFPFTDSDLWERSRNQRHQPKTNVVVTIVWVVPIAISRPAIPWIVVPRTATQQLKLPAPSSVSQQSEKTE